MDENVKKALKERFDALPKTVQESILSSEYQNTLVEISKKYQMTVGQLAVLEQETTLVMMGLTGPDEFRNQLVQQLGIDQNKCDQVIADINERVFKKIRDLLKLMNTPEGESPDLADIDAETLKNSGIEIENTPAKTDAAAPTTPAASPLQSRANILNGIENPTSGKPSFVKEQLSGTFSLPKKETTYTPFAPSAIPNPPIQPAQNGTVTPKSASSDAPVKDPYREIV